MLERNHLIYQAVKDGRKQIDVAREYQLSRQRISAICRRMAKILGEERIMPKRKRYKATLPTTYTTSAGRAMVEAIAAARGVQISDIMRQAPDALYQSLSNEERRLVDAILKQEEPDKK